MAKFIGACCCSATLFMGTSVHVCRHNNEYSVSPRKTARGVVIPMAVVCGYSSGCSRTEHGQSSPTAPHLKPCGLVMSCGALVKTYSRCVGTVFWCLSVQEDARNHAGGLRGYVESDDTRHPNFVGHLASSMSGGTVTKESYQCRRTSLLFPSPRSMNCWRYGRLLVQR